MSLSMRWVGEGDFDRVAMTRALCYGHASKDLPSFAERLRADGRAKDGDFLLAERDGQAVGTATALSLSMWMRGARTPCQGVAWVGTIKTHRRKSKGNGRGVASQIMDETLRLARERGEWVSALMPFRGSFYDHFGYGIVERMCSWTVPLAILPSGDFDGVGFLEPSDLEALTGCRQRQVERGQCDIERSAAGWAVYLKKWEDGWVAVGRAGDGSIRGYLAFQHVQKEGKDFLNVTETGYDDIPALFRLLHFLSSLRDQYAFATLILPADLPLNRLLRETQEPHRLVNHACAEVRPYTRMATRVLDHRRLIEAMNLPAGRAGKVIVGVMETEGNESRFEIDLSDGRAGVTSSAASAEFECSDRIWAAIVSGDLPAAQAVRLGIASARSTGATEVLEAFSVGPLPFCQEYF